MRLRVRKTALNQLIKRRFAFAGGLAGGHLTDKSAAKSRVIRVTVLLK